jgi:hypothetical protein
MIGLYARPTGDLRPSYDSSNVASDDFFSHRIF